MNYFIRVNISFYFFTLLILLFSCKKPIENISPEITITEPTDFSVYLALDTIRVKAHIKDDEELSKSISVYVRNQNQNIVSDVWLSSIQGKDATIIIQIPLSDRWLPSGEYFLTVSVNDGYQTTWAQKSIVIQGIPKRFVGLIVGVENNNSCDIYVSDTTFLFQKVHSLNFLEDGFYDYRNSRFISIHSTGVARFYYYPDWALQKEITNLKKVGSPFSFDWKNIYPYVYITNANGFIYAFDKDANIRQTVNTLFSPYKILFNNNTWLVLSKYYPEPYSWIEVPLMRKNYRFNGQLVAIYRNNEQSYLVIEQKQNSVALHKYTKENNFLSKEKEFNGMIFRDGIVINNQVYLSLNDKVYIVHPLYFTLQEVLTNLELSMFKYEESNLILTAVSQEYLYFINPNNFQLINTIALPGKIKFYDFLYN